MTTAVDTNILIDVLTSNPEFYQLSAAALQHAVTKSPLVICDAVYAELSGFVGSRHQCDAFLSANHILVESLTREALFLAGSHWVEYRQRGGQRARVLADFLIGAHAQVQASRLISRDRGFYRKYFASLKLIDPSRTGSKKN